MQTQERCEVEQIWSEINVWDILILVVLVIKLSVVLS